jgi:hypothetical protein
VGLAYSNNSTPKLGGFHFYVESAPQIGDAPRRSSDEMLLELLKSSEMSVLSFYQ